MSYLKFRQLNFVSRDEFEGTIFAWPVLAVPVRYWAAVPSALDILEKALLALLNTGLRQPAELQQLLGIPPSMDNMIERALRQLQARNYVNDRLYLTEQGSQALVDDETVTREFRQGWLLFDQVQGGVFPYIHSGHLPFFRADMAAKFPMIKIPAQAFLPPEQELRQMGAAALVAYNRSIVLLAAIEDDAENRRPSDLDRDLDLLVELPELASFERERIDDIELLPMVLYEGHHLLVEVVGELLPGSTQIRLHAYSPFSTWEQARYLDTLTQLEIPQVQKGLAEMEKRIRQAGDEAVRSRIDGRAGDIIATVTHTIREELEPKTKLPTETVDRLIWCEYAYILTTQSANNSYPHRRETIFNDWGIFLEATLKQISDEIDAWPIPNNWPKAEELKDNPLHWRKVWRWYKDEVTNWGGSSAWLDLPKGVANNLKNGFRYGFKDTFGHIYTSSSRDVLIKLMLASLSSSLEKLPQRTKNIAVAIDQGQFPFSEFDELVDWRNDAAHGGQKINQMSEEEYFERLTRGRGAIYSILKQLFSQ